MGFWKAVKAVSTIGGSYRLDKANARYQLCKSRYERLRGLVSTRNNEIEGLIFSLKRSVDRTKKKLRLADKMLAPRCLRMLSTARASDSGRPTYEYAIRQHSHAGKEVNSWGSTHLTLGGAVAGTSAAILAWQGAQVVGIASTGTAMLGLHGAAATNAGWALFGGGSLATGGGGMALGHLVLPGIGVAVAIGVGAVSTHMEANKVGRLCEQIDAVNSQNAQILSTVESDLQRLQKAELNYVSADRKLSFAVRVARRKLRRFGILSVFYRYLRFKISGVYYTESEWIHVERLENSVRVFFSSMTVVKNS